MSNPSQPIFSRSSNFERRMFFCVWTFLPFYVSIFIFSCASRQPEKLVYCPEMVWTFITQTEMRPWCRALGITFPVAKQDNLPQLKVNQNCVVIYYLLALQLLCYSWQSLKVYNPKHNTHTVLILGGLVQF